MAFITKIEIDPIGEFSINFSYKFGRFEISKYPEGVFDKVGGSPKVLKTWENVNEELDRIKEVWFQEVLFLRKVIIIDLQTSESTYEVLKKKWKNEEFELVRTEDFLHDGMGFILKWYIAEEYEYPQKPFANKYKKYKVIESGDNCKGKEQRINILGQLFMKDVRVVEYREDLHIFLKNLDGVIKEMLQKLISYFDVDVTKFLKNFEQGKLKLLG